MKTSETIIAVNTDPEAAIFDVAHYGAVADLFDVAEELAKLVVTETRQTFAGLAHWEIVFWYVLIAVSTAIFFWGVARLVAQVPARTRGAPRRIARTPAARSRGRRRSCSRTAGSSGATRSPGSATR